MDYKGLILEKIIQIDNEKLLRFIYYMIEDSMDRYLFTENPLDIS